MPIKPISIPIALIGKGSQPDPVPAMTIGVPETVETYSMPMPATSASKETALKAREFFIEIYNEMALWNIDSGEAGPAFALDKYDVETLKFINDILGEGEVSIRIVLPNDDFDEIRILETVFVGVWRVRCYKDGKPISDQIEVSAIPICVPEAAFLASSDGLKPTEPDPDAMNSPAILAELKTALEQWEPGSAPFTVNLSHLPMSPADNRIVDEAVGEGVVKIVSHGYGNCHIASTAVRHLWRIQYLNNAPTKLMILNTLVVTGLPEEAIAAPEDLRDSTQRIKETVEWVTSSWELPPVEWSS
ncbi:MAG: hydrogenase expression/formation protein [Burkholderiales bacterium]|nr:hydrogenase expression/formation protein [Burkholderiales bacterium]